jgi:hypothetical protein
MGQEFQRACRITVGSTQITGLAMRFEIKKTLKVQPNSAVVRITNLSHNSRKSLEAEKTLPCTVEAGYGGDLHTLFQGQVRRGSSVQSGKDIITTVSSGDSDQTLTANRLALSVPKGATPEQILKLAGQLMGASAGNVSSIAAFAGGALNATQFHGNAADAMSQITRSSGLEWSIQDGALQVLPIGQPITTAKMVSLSGSSGLVGSPSVDSKGIVSARALIQPDLLPGRCVRIDSIGVQGDFRIEEVTFTGDTWGQDWYADIHAKRFS